MEENNEGTNENKLDPGTVEIHSAWIINSFNKVDVRQIISSMNIYEDISSPFITGSIVLSDTNNLLSQMKFRGEERLILELKTPLLEIERVGNFHLFKLEDRENLAQKDLIYRLHFISIEAFTDQNKRISQTFRGRISDTVENICKKGLLTGKDVHVEPTGNNEVHTSNFWTPIQNIHYLTKKAINNKNNSNYLFFETEEGFVFSSLDTLFKLPVHQQFIKGQHSRSTDPSEDPMVEYMKVLDMSIPDFYDYIGNHNNGLYGGALYVTDIEKKQIDFLKYKAKDEYHKSGKLNKGEHIFDSVEEAFNVESVVKSKVTHSDLYENKASDYDNRETRRNSLLSQLELIKTNIKVFGRCDYTVGRIVELKVFLEKQVDEKTMEEDEIDKILSGRYLVSAINHEITNKSHYTFLELIKDSYLK